MFIKNTNPNDVQDANHFERKKEVVDYIRNAQRLHEQNLKVSGINSWVLIGALALFIWYGIQIDKNAFNANSFETIIKIIVISILFKYIKILLPNNTRSTEIRFKSKYKEPKLEALTAWVILQVWELFPLMLYAYFITYKSASTFFLGIMIIVVIAIIGDEFKEQKGRFPEPSFTKTIFTFLDLFIPAIFFTVFIYQIYIDIQTISGIFPTFSLEQLKLTLLVFASFWAIYLLADISAFKSRINWLNELEKHLLFDSIQPNEAIAQIENRVLGSRLSTIMNKFWQDYKIAKQSFDDSLNQIKTAIGNIHEIPKEYKAERLTRISTQNKDSSEKFKQLENLLEELNIFLTDFQKQTAKQKPEISAAISSISEQYKTEKINLQNLNAEKKRIIDNV